VLTFARLLWCVCVRTSVIVNVYDLFILNYTTSKFGLGAYHSGVEIFGREYSYAGHTKMGESGLHMMIPRVSAIPGAMYK
jgi:hypothetical protein